MFSPHLVVGFLFLVVHSRPLLLPLAVSLSQLAHTHRTCSHTTYSHTTLSRTTHSHVAGVALGDIDFAFAWQASRLWRWAGSCDCDALCARSSPVTPRSVAWQAWRLVTSRAFWRGRQVLVLMLSPSDAVFGSSQSEQDQTFRTI